MEGAEFQEYVRRLERTAEIVQSYKSIAKELCSLNKQLQHLLVQQKQQLPALQLCSHFARFSGLFLKYADLNVQLRQLTPTAPLCLPDFTPGPKKFTDTFMYTRQQLDNLMVWTGYMEYSRIQKWYEQRLAKVPEKRTLVELQIGCTGDRFIEMFHFYVKNRVESVEAPALTLEPDYVKKQCVRVALGSRAKGHQLDPGEQSLRVQFGEHWKVPRKFVQKEVCGYTMEEKVYLMHIQQQKMEREKQDKQKQILTELVQSRIGRRSSAVSPPGTAAVSRSALVSSGSLGPLPPLKSTPQDTKETEEKELAIRWVSGGTVKEEITTQAQQTVYDRNMEELSDQYATDDLSRTRGATWQDDEVKRAEKPVQSQQISLKKLKEVEKPKKEIKEKKLKEIGVQTVEWEQPSTSEQVKRVEESAQTGEQDIEKPVQKPAENMESAKTEKGVCTFYFDVPHFYPVIMPTSVAEKAKNQMRSYQVLSNQIQDNQNQAQATSEAVKQAEVSQFYFQGAQNEAFKPKEVQTIITYQFDVPHFYNLTPLNTAAATYSKVAEVTETKVEIREAQEPKKVENETQEIKQETQENKVNAYSLLAGEAVLTQQPAKASAVEPEHPVALTGYKPAGSEKQIFFDIPYFYCPGSSEKAVENPKKVKKVQNNPCYFVDYTYESAAERHQKIIAQLKAAGVKIVTDEMESIVNRNVVQRRMGAYEAIQTGMSQSKQEKVVPYFDLPYFYCVYKSEVEIGKLDAMKEVAQSLQAVKVEEKKHEEAAEQSEGTKEGIAIAYAVLAGK